MAALIYVLGIIEGILETINVLLHSVPTDLLILTTIVLGIFYGIKDSKTRVL